MTQAGTWGRLQEGAGCTNTKLRFQVGVAKTSVQGPHLAPGTQVWDPWSRAYNSYSNRKIHCKTSGQETAFSESLVMNRRRNNTGTVATIAIDDGILTVCLWLVISAADIRSCWLTGWRCLMTRQQSVSFLVEPGHLHPYLNILRDFWGNFEFWRKLLSKFKS